MPQFRDRGKVEMIAYLIGHRVDAALIAMCALGIAAAYLLAPDAPACGGSPQALPWLMMQVSGCPEGVP